MRNYYLFLIVFFIFIKFYKISCDLDYKTTKVFSTKTSISYEFIPSADYFDSLVFQKVNTAQFQLNFTCNLSTQTAIRRCIAAQISNDSLKKMYGEIHYCLNGECSFLPLYNPLYPTPIVNPDLRPSTRGGLTQFQGSFLKFQGDDYFNFPDGNSVPMKAELTSRSKSFDPTNITLDYPSGCGFQQIKWANGQIYNFSYANPTILNATFIGNEITINGYDFCSNQFPVTVLIDNVLVTSAISHDHEYVKFIQNQIYSKKSNIKLITSNVTSVEKLIEFPPEPTHINSVPSNKGGTVTITGFRLSSDNSNDVVLVSIGSLECTNVKSTPTELTCSLKPLAGTVAANDYPVAISVGGIKNQNKLSFKFDVPFINPIYYLPDGNLNITGNCLGDTIRTSVFLNGTETKIPDLFIDKSETMLSFKLGDIPKVNVSIKVNGVQSNAIQVDASFFASSPNILPSTNGGSVIYTLYHIKPVNFNEIPTITIHPDGKPIKGVLCSIPANKEIQSFSFQIPQGCGEVDTSITIGYQECSVKLKYQAPIISNCSVSNDGTTVQCFGDFGNPLFYNTLNVQFSDDHIDTKLVNNAFKFPLKSSYRTNPILLEICNVQATSIILNISQTLSNQTNYYFNTTGGTFYLYGEHLMSQTNASVTCNNQTFNSKYENSSVISFEILIDGPYDLNCKYSFDNGKNQSDFMISYPSPSISNTSKIQLSGGPLTIYGDNFYSNIKDCKITISNINECLDITFINSNTIKCNLPPFNSIIDQSNIEISYNNLKNANLKIIIYGGDNDGSNLNSIDNDGSINNLNHTAGNNNHNNNNNSHRLIIIIIPTVLCSLIFIIGIIVLSYYVKKSKDQRKIRKEDFKLRQQQRLESIRQRDLEIIEDQKEEKIFEEARKEAKQRVIDSIERQKKEDEEFKNFKKYKDSFKNNNNNNINNNNNNNNSSGNDNNDGEGSSSTL